MTSRQQKQPINSVSESSDERKRKKLISNRESARRSRMKKQQQLDELVALINQLKNENKVIMHKIDGATQATVEVSSENNVMRNQLTALTDRLQSLNNVLYIAQEVSGLDMDIPEVPNTLLEPWQLPCPVQPITASNVNMFQY